MIHEEEICSRCSFHDKGCAYEIRGMQRKCRDFDYLELEVAAEKLVEAVERYTKPNKGEFCHRSELLTKCNQLKELL